MNELIQLFLQNPSGRRYDELLAKLNFDATKVALSGLDGDQKGNLVTAGIQALGTSEMFYRWLWTTITYEDAKPIDLIRDGQLKRVMDILGRIQYGVYS